MPQRPRCSPEPLERNTTRTGDVEGTRIAPAAQRKLRLPPNVASIARTWRRASLPGYCATTTTEADCETADRGTAVALEGARAQHGVAHPRAFSSLTAAGTWQLPRSVVNASWDVTIAACLARCALCTRCTAISVARRWRDCSWFAACDLDGSAALRTDVGGFVSGAALPPAVAAAVVEAAPLGLSGGGATDEQHLCFRRTAVRSA